MGSILVYTTAYAREELQEAIKLCGYKLVYVDTDSVKTEGKVNISILNTSLKETAEKMKAYADDMHGKRHYIGLFEDDGHYQRFITQGAKRYAYIDDRGRMGITVAGVSKKIDELTDYTDMNGDTYHPTIAVEELGSLENFKVGMIWREAGGTISVYKDHDDFDYTDPESGNTIHIGKNVCIVQGTYEMKYSKDYALLLGEIELYGEYQRKRE